MSAPLDVFFFCNDPARDPCAATVFRALEQLPAVVRADGEFDGFPLLRARRQDGSLALFVRTQMSSATIMPVMPVCSTTGSAMSGWRWW